MSDVTLLLERAQQGDPKAAGELLPLVHEALDDLAAEDPQAADLVKLRYFVGMNMAEAATALNVPQRTAERLWTVARAWLRGAMK